MWLGLSVEFWLGTAFAVLLAVLTTIVAFPRKQIGQVSVGIIQAVSLIADVARQVSGLKVTYRDNEIQGELGWISGLLVNSGDFDIGRSIVSRYPLLTLNDAEWQEFSIGDARKDIDASAEKVSAEEVLIKWSLLKPGESIPFHALVKAQNRSAIDELRQGRNFSVSARIENVRCEFDRQILDSPEVARRRVWSSVGDLFFAVVVVLGFSVFLTVGVLSDPRNTGLRFWFAVVLFSLVDLLGLLLFLTMVRKSMRSIRIYKRLSPNSRILDFVYKRPLKDG